MTGAAPDSMTPRARSASEGGFRRPSTRAIACFIGCGVLLNIVIAWVIVLTVKQSVSGMTRFGIQGRTSSWPASVPPSWPQSADDRVEWTGIGIRKTAATAVVPSTTPGMSDESVSIVLIETGFPFRAVKAESPSWWSANYCPPTANGLLYTAKSGFRIPDWIADLTPGSNTSLPIFPLINGFLLNTLFYAGILYLVFSGFGEMRRLLRPRAGLCPRCKYPIGPSPVCTECGRAVPPRKLTA